MPYHELDKDDLEFKCLLSDYQFQNTNDLEDLDGIIGQERASNALTLGLSIESTGYNIYVAGLSGCGKTTYVKTCAQQYAKNKKTPDDICYVYNFDEARKPKALIFPAGMGRQFRDDMNELSAVLKIEIPKAFADDDFEKQKNEILKNYQDTRDLLMDEMEQTAEEYEFGVKTTNSGIYFMPKINGETISEEEYDDLSEEKKKVISKKSDLVQDKASEFMRKIKEEEKVTRKEIEDLEYKIGLIAVGSHISSLKEKYKDYPETLAYLSKLSEDVLDNIYDFTDKDEEEDEQLSSLLPWLNKKSDDDNLNKYKANLFIDNSQLEGAPVIIDYNPAYYNIVGEVEYDNEFGNLVTDFMKIKPGLLHKANGGYLILQASDIFSSERSWEALKRAIKTKEAVIESFRDQLSAAAFTIKPQAVPLEVKVILVGNAYYYDLLKYYDDDFCKHFKIFAEFDYEMPLNDENTMKIASFIKKFTEIEKTRPFTKEAVLEIIRYGARIAEKRDFITSEFGKLRELLVEAVAYAQPANNDCIGKADVLKALEEQRKRHCLLEEKMGKMIEDETIMIDTSASKIGQINGLAVLETNNYSFAKPCRITATAYMGMSGIINIEKEAEMSGSIHEKGVQVLTGYLGQTYAQEFPLSLSARLCFEQSYSEIDGDSASCAELFVLLSCISGIPIEQNIAVTGSVNQMGEVQAVGGVNYKVEGFFDLCRQRGLTGNQGVIVPVSCVKDLVLKQDVIDAVEQGLFHIYPISHVNEGIEIIMGMPAGEKRKKGGFSEKTVHGLVYRKLKRFHQKNTSDGKK